MDDYFQGNGMLQSYANAPSGAFSGFSLSGALQNAMTLGGAYLTRRLDIDLARRIGGLAPDGTMQGNVTPTAAVAGAPSDTLGGMLPLLLLVGGAVLLFKALD